MMARLNALARMAAQRTDVVIVAFMLMAIAMMIIPLPTYLVDTLIAINIALSGDGLGIFWSIGWASAHRALARRGWPPQPLPFVLVRCGPAFFSRY